MKRCSLTALFCALLAVAVSAQTTVPTPEEFLGYPLGSRFTPHHRIVEYFQELAKRSPLITIQPFGETYEGRPLILATITSAKNRAAIDAIRGDITSLARPNSIDTARAEQIAAATPAVAWLAFGVHGNESSSAEAAMLVASTLLRDADSAHLLDNLVVVIDPLQNPDGRERYIQWFHRTRGAQPDPNPDSFEHNEPWPGGRTNHYLIDMNRDWTWLSQKESQARAAVYRDWNPQVFVDFHEMGYQSTYFFPPDAKPINTNLPVEVEKWLEVFGRANAEVFSQRGWPFFVAERFDLFYPGYGDSWPSLHGAIGMTYEVAGHSRAGTTVTRDDGATMTLADRIQRHFTTGMTTLRTAAEHRRDLLLYTYRAMKAPLEAAGTTFLISPQSPNFDTLVGLLQRQSIEVGMLTAPATIRATSIEGLGPEPRSFPAGTAVVSTRQPLGGLARTLLEETATFSKGFVEEQRAKAESDEPDDFYDLTVWSLPLAMNVDASTTAAQLPAPPKPYATAGMPAFRSASYGYLVDGLDPNVYRLAGRMLAGDIAFSVSESDLTVGERSFARGTLIILKGSNRPDLDAKLERLSRDSGALVTPLSSGWLGGTALGSEKIRYVKQPKIGLIGGAGTNATSFGMLWHTLDIDTPIPHTVLGLDGLRNVDLGHYEVLVFPDGEYVARLGKTGIERMRAWVRAGGTLVAIKGATAFLREKDLEMSKVKPWEPPKKKDDEKETVESRYNEYRVPGSAFRSVINTRSYLTFGLPQPPALLIEGTITYQPVPHKVDNIVTVDAKDPLISGVAWPESLERLKGAAYLVSEPFGKGNVITFADEPYFRLFWRGTLPLFLNAVLYSRSFPRDDSDGM